jgi:hypothetical protein
MSQIEPSQQTEIEKRKSAGKAGKLCTIEVYFEDLDIDNESRQKRKGSRYTLKNQYWAEVMKFRQMVYTAGLMVMVAPDHWKVIHPMDIRTVDIWRQNDYFKEY